MIETGILDRVAYEVLGSSLVVDAAIGDTTLYLDWVAEFDEGGGQASLDGSTFAYAGLDADQDTLSIPGSGCPVAGVAGDPVASLSAAGEERGELVAWVRLDDGMEPVSYRIDTSLEGRLTEDTPPGTPLEVDSSTRMVIGRPDIPTAIDLTHSLNLPDPAVAVTVPPDSSPAFKVKGFSEGLVVYTDPIAISTVLDVYVDGVLAVTGERGGPISVDVNATGAPMSGDPVDTQYAITMVARNAAGSAAASGPVMGQRDEGTPSLEVFQNLLVVALTTSFLQIGTSMTLGPDGLTITMADGRQTCFRSDGSGNQIIGQAILDAATILGNLTVLGQTNVLGGLFTMLTGVSNPTGLAGVTLNWDTLPFAGGGTPSMYRGLAEVDSTHWALTYSAPFSYSVTLLDKTTGALAGGFFMPGGFVPLGGVVLLGTSYYVLGRDDADSGQWKVFIFDSSGAKTGGWDVTYSAGSAYKPCIATDGTDIVIARTTTLGKLAWAHFNPATGVQSGSSVISGDNFGADYTSFSLVSTGFAGARAVVGYAAGIRVYSYAGTTATRQTADEWPKASSVYGMSFDGSLWHSQDGEQVSYYTGHGGLWDFSFAWVDDDPGGTGTAETRPSDIRTVRLARQRVTMSLPSAPFDDGTPDGSNTASFYAAPHGSTLVRQVQLAEGVLSYTTSSLATTGTAPQTVNGFANRPGALGRWASQAVDSGGDPLSDFDGTGAARFAKFQQSGTTTVNVTSTARVFSQAVTFPVEFDVVPRVFVQEHTTLPGKVHVSHDDPTTTGFTVYVMRDAGAGSGNTKVSWTATTAD